MPDLENALESYRKGFLENFRKLDDSPALENLQFNFSTYGEQLARYITSEDLPTPSTIGLNGEWGSGKTTMIKTIQQNIDKMNGKEGCVDTTYLDFNAWAAEKTDIVVSLFQEISEFLRMRQHNTRSQIKKFTGSWIPLVADVALRKWGGGMTYDAAKKHFEKSPPSIKIISEQIKVLLSGKRLVIFIDDLDRCNASNILELLETIRNVLSVGNLIFCITVDIKQIERAWELRYNSDVGEIESKEYVEKLLPVVYSLPPKTDDEVRDYFDSLVTLYGEYGKLRVHLIKSLTSNPRKMKRMLNIIFFVIQNYDLNNCDVNAESNIRKECQLHFSLIITWMSLTINHKKISKILQAEPSAFMSIVLFVNACNSFTEFKKLYGQFEVDGHVDIPHDKILHIFNPEIFTSSVVDILKIMLENQLAFKTLKQMGEFIDKPEEFNFDTTSVVYTNDFISAGYGGVSEIFKKITEKGGLVGT